MALEEYCAACTELSENGDYSGKYFCFNFGEDRYACDPKCHRFSEAYSRSDSARKNMYNNSLSHQSGSGCYLTTAMCHILGYPDNNYYLEMLRMFRDNVLKQDFKYISLLLMYDMIGPQISMNLYKDEDREIISKTLFTKYIIKSVEAIENNKTQEAINIYVAMTNSLANRYNINTHILQMNPNDVDINSLGHGRCKTRRLEDSVSF